MQILDNFLLRVEGDRLSITGSDAENVLTAYMSISDSDGDGVVAVSAKRLLEITKEIANQPLSFYINENTKEIELNYLNGEFNFMGVDATEYPERREVGEDALSIIIPGKSVLEGISKTLFAVSTETVRPIMTGIYWDIHENDVTFVSSDTHKLVRYINTDCRPGMNASFILPSKPANILKSLLDKEEGDVKIVFDPKGATFEFGDYLLSCIFINGNYPNYNRVIPQGTPFELTADRGSLLAALRRVILCAPKSSNLVVLKVDSDRVHFVAQDLDYGSHAEQRVVCSYDGTPMTLGFNGAFMIEILNNIDNETIVLKLSDPARPGIYSPLEQPADGNLVVIQMPMQTF